MRQPKKKLLLNGKKGRKMKLIYTRRGKTLTNINTGKEQVFKFINEAKRESRAIQQANGGLGRGAIKIQ